MGFYGRLIISGIVLCAGAIASPGRDTWTLNLTGVANGRLTLTSATPITTSDVSAATVLYYTPYQGNKISLYSGTAWQLFNFSELSLAIGTLTDAKNYDVFIYNNGGTPAIDTVVAWTDNTTRATALTTQDGIYVKSGAATRRYVGTFRTTSTTTTEDSVTKRFLWNYYNRVPRYLAKQSAATSWLYNTGSWRVSGGVDTNKVELVSGVAEGLLQLTFTQYISTNSLSYAAICEDVSNSYTAGIYGYGPSGMLNAKLIKTPGIGWRTYYMVEYGNATTSWYGAGNQLLSGTFDG